MKEHLTITELAAELKRQAQAAIDITLPTTALAVRTEVKRLTDGEHLDVTTHMMIKTPAEGVPSEIVVNDTTHRQVAAHLGVPFKFYERLRTTQPDMLDFNVNELFTREPKSRLVRTLDGNARAFLSNNYNLGLSNLALAEYLLPTIGELGGIVRSSAITDRKAYIKIVTPKIEREVKRVGQIVRLGVVLYNSEVGFGKWGFDLFTENLSCTNGMTVENTGFAKSHIGKALGDGETVRRYLSDETRAAEDRALMLGSRDVLKGVFNEAMLDEHVNRLELAAETPLVKGVGDQREKVAETVTKITRGAGLNETEGASVLDHLINGGDLSVFGLAQAVTRTAEDLPSYDRASELERLGGQIVTLPRDKWRVVGGDGNGDELALGE